MPADVTDFRIQRSTDGQIFTTYATANIATMNFVDDGDDNPATSGPGLPPGSRFWYRLRAIGGTTGGTSYTPKQAGTTSMIAPENVRGTAQSSTSILVQWDDLTTNVPGDESTVPIAVTARTSSQCIGIPRRTRRRWNCMRYSRGRRR